MGILYKARKVQLRGGNPYVPEDYTTHSAPKNPKAQPHWSKRFPSEKATDDFVNTVSYFSILSVLVP